MDGSFALTAAKTTSISLAFIATGYGISASQNVLPRLYREKPQVSTPIFAHVFRAGGRFIVPTTLLSSAASLYLAYAIPEQRQLWTTVAISTLAGLPWTRLVMYKGIRRLIDISESEKECHKCEGSGEHVYLMERWTFQNYVRASMFALAGFSGLWAVLGEK
jgi:hypothetical protein